MNVQRQLQFLRVRLEITEETVQAYETVLAYVLAYNPSARTKVLIHRHANRGGEDLMVYYDALDTLLKRSMDFTPKSLKRRGPK